MVGDFHRNKASTCTNHVRLSVMHLQAGRGTACEVEAVAYEQETNRIYAVAQK
jgi:hypothetical protein